MKMKHIYSLLMALGIILILSLSASGANQSGLHVQVNGEPMDMPEAYISQEGVTMVPLRALSEALGCDVAWDPITRTVLVASPQPEEVEEVTPLYSGLVVLDPGHGGEAEGAVYGGVQEKDLNLAIATQAAGYLEASGVTVVMTRTEDSDVDLYERTELANNLGADLFVSVHCNASEDYDDVTGIYTCAYSEGTDGWRLAELLHRTMIFATGAEDFGMEERPNLAVLRTSLMPAALVECGFMSTPEELEQLVRPEYQARLAKGIADGILAYLAQ